jgi:hypothetical protein
LPDRKSDWIATKNLPTRIAAEGTSKIPRLVRRVLKSFKVRHEEQTVFPVEQLWDPDGPPTVNPYWFN